MDIDLVLLDINTPGVDASDVYSHFSNSQVNHNTPIILMVTKEQECQLEYLPVGVTDCITKPFQPSIVVARVQSQLKLKRFRDLWESPLLDILRKLDVVLTREWQRAFRNQTPISLILIDIDFYKEYERSEGQSASDNCLKLVGNALRKCAKRDVDFLASHDTHAFVCLLPDTDTDGTQQVCRKMQQKVAELNIPHPCSPVADRVTLSIGVATARPTTKDGQYYLRYQAEVSLENARSLVIIRSETHEVDNRRSYGYGKI